MTTVTEELPFILHGSADSLDKDIVYILPKMLSYHDALLFCNYKKGENRNIMTMYPTGVVKQCMKGLPDEINNSLLVTYPLHQQQHEMLINRPVTRIIPLKVVRGIRSVLSHLSKSSLRPVIKPALRSSDLGEYLRVLEKVDFNEESVKNLLDVEICKMLGFQLGQTLALVEGTELYTKGQISEHWPELSPFMKRQEELVLSSLSVLNKFNDLLVAHLKPLRITPLKEHKVGVFSCAFRDNPLQIHEQCSHVIVIDMQPGKERCLHFGHIDNTLLSELTNIVAFACFFKVVDGPVVAYAYTPEEKKQDIKISQQLTQLLDAYPKLKLFIECCATGCSDELEQQRIDLFEEKLPLDISIAVIKQETHKLALIGARDKSTNEAIATERLSGLATKLELQF
jgi:hypothetical protein